MNTNKLTPGNIKYIAVPRSLHAKLQAQAKAQHATIYEVIADLADKAERFDIARAALKNGDDNAD